MVVVVVFGAAVVASAVVAGAVLVAGTVLVVGAAVAGAVVAGAEVAVVLVDEELLDEDGVLDLGEDAEAPAIAPAATRSGQSAKARRGRSLSPTGCRR